MHYDKNGWPIVPVSTKYIGMIDDNNNEPIFYREDLRQAMIEMFEIISKNTWGDSICQRLKN